MNKPITVSAHLTLTSKEIDIISDLLHNKIIETYNPNCRMENQNLEDIAKGIMYTDNTPEENELLNDLYGIMDKFEIFIVD